MHSFNFLAHSKENATSYYNLLDILKFDNIFKLKVALFAQKIINDPTGIQHSLELPLKSRDISIRHFQYGGVCLHFTGASFNTVFSKSNFKITLIFSKMTLHLNYVV